MKVKLEMKEGETENLKLKADYESLRSSNLEKELEAVKVEYERKLTELRKLQDASSGKGVASPTEAIKRDLKDYGNELPNSLDEENFQVTHNTNFSVGLINFAVQTLIAGFEK